MRIDAAACRDRCVVMLGEGWIVVRSFRLHHLVGWGCLAHSMVIIIVMGDQVLVASVQFISWLRGFCRVKIASACFEVQQVPTVIETVTAYAEPKWPNKEEPTSIIHSKSFLIAQTVGKDWAAWSAGADIDRSSRLSCCCSGRRLACLCVSLFFEPQA